MNSANHNNNPIKDALERNADGAIPPEIERLARQRLEALREKMDANTEKAQIGFWGNLALHWRRTAALATPAVVLIVAALALWIAPMGDSSSSAYAVAVRQIRNARTLMMTMVTHLPEIQGVPKMPDMKTEVAYKEPGLMSMSMSMGAIGAMGGTGEAVKCVMDVAGKRMVMTNPMGKDFIEFNLKDQPSNASARQFDWIEKMRSLPERASERLGTKELDGRLVEGFRAAENGMNSKVWLDARTHELVCVESSVANSSEMSVTMSNFRFDLPLDPAMFSMEMPEGYHRQTMNIDASEPDEKSLVEFLRAWPAEVSDGRFPSSCNMQDLMKEMAEKAPHLKDHKDQADREKVMQESMEKTMRLTKGMVYVMKMKPENDWHYSGKNVKLGEAETPIAWWKPDGAKDYRVIYGDLTVKNVAPENVPTEVTRPDAEMPETTPTPTGDAGAPENIGTPKSVEEDVVEFLRYWATEIGDGTFPPSVDMRELEEKLKEKPAHEINGEEDELDQSPEAGKIREVKRKKRMLDGIVAVAGIQMNRKSDWHYAGKGVKLGEAQTPIAWWKPADGAKDYRVIYGDLTVKNVAPEALPQDPVHP